MPILFTVGTKHVRGSSRVCETSGHVSHNVPCPTAKSESGRFRWFSLAVAGLCSLLRVRIKH